MLVVFEILLFLIVNGIEFANNNADPELNYEFNLHKLQRKVKPLTIALCLSFSIMLIGQVLLSYEGNDEAVRHCREATRNSILFLNSISPLQLNSNKELLELLETPGYCGRFISEGDALAILNLQEKAINYPSQADEFTAEVLRIEADNYQKLSASYSSFSRQALFLILVLNVLFLSSLALHLKMDSEDIG